jgi:predicted unusual protein kinase regulating ubiquinone biosynthesis (AarF/ABC1/UbiB family)
LGLAYLAYWIRSWYLPKDQRERELLDTHLRSALNTLETMGYLRGAVSKLGQLLTCFPESIPDEFVDTLSNLQFQAPPMHYALIREQLLEELGDPEELGCST